MKASLVFMAAGFGSRFGGGVKQIAPIGPHGEVLMDYAAHDALRAGFDRIIFIIRKDLEKVFRAGVGRRVEAKCDVEYVFQDVEDLPAGFSVPDGRAKPWGTGQAVLACRRVIREPFCVLNADDYYGPSAFRQVYNYIQAMQPGKLDCCMPGYILENSLSESGPVTRGLCQVDGEGKLRRIRECRGMVLQNGVAAYPEEEGMRLLPPGMHVSMNMWGLPAAFIGYLEEQFPIFLSALGEQAATAEFLLPVVIGAMVESGRGSVQVLGTDESWFGMTYASDVELAKAKIRELIADGLYPEKL